MDNRIIDIKAKIIPITPVMLKFSLKIKTPIRIVISKLKIDHNVPTIES